MFSTELEITAALTGNAYEHVHHADVVRLLEQGRLALLTSMNRTLEAMFAEGLLLVVASIDVHFRRELVRGEVTATISDPQIDGKRLWLSQEIVNEKGKVCVRAKVELAFMSLQTRRAIAVPDDFIEALNRKLE